MVSKAKLWVPGIPCRIISSSSILREAGKFDDSGMRGSYVTLAETGHDIIRRRRRVFVTLTGRIAARQIQHKACARFTKKNSYSR